MINYRVRRAASDDWRLVRSVRLQALADTPDAFGTTLAKDQDRADSEWIARVANPGVAHFLAGAPSGNQVGMVVGAPYTDFEDAAGLFGMWVSPDVRGRGIGSTLVDAVVEWARGGEYKRILLHVADDNIAAIRLYESKGFLPTGRTGTIPPPREHIQEHERCLTLE